MKIPPRTPQAQAIVNQEQDSIAEDEARRAGGMQLIQLQAVAGFYKLLKTVTDGRNKVQDMLDKLDAMRTLRRELIDAAQKLSGALSLFA